MAKSVNRIVQGLAAVMVSTSKSSWGGTVKPPYLLLANTDVKADAVVLESMASEADEARTSWFACRFPRRRMGMEVYCVKVEVLAEI